jgi:hypothetical protein
MKPNTNTANNPWLPTCWTGGGRIQQLGDMIHGGYKYMAAVKANAAILRAMRK